LRILDACTGSGCIALALKKTPAAKVSAITAIDISEKALVMLLKENAKDLNLDVDI
jgi:methylase of polypeptide subunit release factors